VDVNVSTNLAREVDVCGPPGVSAPNPRTPA
jgi:hypothetical protein